MDHLWSPWRYQYVAGPNRKPVRCVFCDIAASDQDEANHVVHRAEYNFLVLNRYPYSSGHLLIVPFEHVASLIEAKAEATAEMMRLARLTEEGLRAAYTPDGLNIGINIGASAGAGIANHLHMHALPRWSGDGNFMTTVGETRVLPEDLDTTYRKMKAVCSHW